MNLDKPFRIWKQNDTPLIIQTYHLRSPVFSAIVLNLGQAYFSIIILLYHENQTYQLFWCYILRRKMQRFVLPFINLLTKNGLYFWQKLTKVIDKSAPDVDSQFYTLRDRRFMCYPLYVGHWSLMWSEGWRKPVFPVFCLGNILNRLQDNLTNLNE